MPVSFKVGEDDAGMRVDKLLRRELPSMPLSHIFKLLRTRKVRLNDSRARAEDRLAAGDTVTVRGDPERLGARPEQIGRVQTRRRDFQALFEDEHLMAVVKPAGLAIHPGTGISGATLVDQVRAALGTTPEERGFTPSPAHRLDKETSGVVVVAKTRRAMAAMSELFSSGAVAKTYLAIVKGKMPASSGKIDLPLREHQQTSRSKAMHGARHQAAMTRWRLVSSSLKVSLVEVSLETGRTHQIRRHFASIGHPVVGDRRHGDFAFNRRAKATLAIGRQMLHAWKLSFEHPLTGERLELEAPVPEDMMKAISRADMGETGPTS